MAELKQAQFFMPNIFIGLFLYLRFRFERLIGMPSKIVSMVNNYNGFVYIFQCVPFKNKNFVLFYSCLDKDTADKFALKIQSLTYFIKD